MAVTINEGTQTDILTTQVGGTEAGIVRLDVGTGNSTDDFGGSVRTVRNLEKGTITKLEGGTISEITSLANIVKGTIASVEGLPDLPGGTVDLITTLTTVTNLANLSAGTVSMLHAGTLNEASVIGGAASGAAANGNPVPIAGTDSGGTVYAILVDTDGNPQVDIVNSPTVNVNDIPGGTVDLITTVSAVTNVANLSKGTVTAIEALPDLPGGTIDLITAITTVTDITDVNNLTKGTITKLEGGTIGEITSIANLAAGTVTSLEALPDLPGGTVDLLSNLAGGTVQIDSKPPTTLVSHGTLGTAGGSFFATISASSGSGTKHFVSNVDIVMESGTADVRVLAGSAIQGTGVMAAGKFPAGGGIAKQFSPAFPAGDNSELIYHFVGAGTAFIIVNYWKET